MPRAAKFVVTPWEVKGEVDYEQLIQQFGLSPLNKALLERIEGYTGELHYALRRGIFFAHRDFDWLLNEYDKGNQFYLYTGRGPSDRSTLGHLSTWLFVKWLQDKFDAKLYFQITDDEKYLFRDDLTPEDTRSYAYDNILDLIALGFNPEKTFIFLDTEYAKTIYNQAIKVAKRITFSTARAVFGFTNDSNIGEIFFTSIQAVPAFIESVKQGKNVPCLIPLAVDQDPHFRVARDVLPKLGYYKPAIIHRKFMPGLGRGGKMSSSDPSTAIYTTDTPESAARKVMNAFTGQQPTAELQRKLGGNPEICTVCQYYYHFFEEDDEKVKEIFKKERRGEILAGEHKKDLAERVMKFLSAHQAKREKAKTQIERFMLRD